ncbi:SCO4225 family membrane protein [Kitasatospora sp. Root107]|uniref:SCO4225 family membrane protein n=1 Tax=Kitasatospora sp. Root107 TaxID=1736424 RepID=UPI00070AB0DB|nr:hypothetical protein [Kitasatospora sp. Root107]KQV11927.1 hypothetical protein ASC99_35740 [Kitasatospora sp. Root107]
MVSSTGIRLRRIRTQLVPAFDNPLSLAYLALVAAAAAVFVHAACTTHDISFAGMWLDLVTAPFGLLALPIPAVFWDTPVEWLGPVLSLAASVSAALVNAAFLGRLVSRLRPGTRSARTAG